MSYQNRQNRQPQQNYKHKDFCSMNNNPPLVYSKFTVDPNAKSKYEEQKAFLANSQFSPQRGENFVEFISNILSKISRIPPEKVSEYIKHIDIFEQAFTHKTANENNNYEALEMIGDSILNFCVVEYLSNRFPDLMNTDGSGVGTLARLKINLVSKSVFSNFAEKLNFGDYIASDMLVRRDEMDSILEDTFEAFQGALITVIKKCDPNYRKGYLVGLGPVYRIISYFLDSMEISLKYEDLYDAKTRFKNAMTMNDLKSEISYSQMVDSNGRIVFTVILKMVLKTGPVQWKAQDFKKAGAEQLACDMAIESLKKMGYKTRMHA